MFSHTYQTTELTVQYVFKSPIDQLREVILFSVSPGNCYWVIETNFEVIVQLLCVLE